MFSMAGAMNCAGNRSFGKITVVKSPTRERIVDIGSYLVVMS
jgi:hypothetical protein